MYKIKNLAKKTLNRKLLEEFLDFANKKLEVDKPYSVYFVDDKSNATDPLGKTAMYNPSSNSVYVYATNRHPKDILRSIAHELMHHKQNCDGRLDKTYGEDSDDLETLELEANKAGYLVREFEDGRKNKELNEVSPYGGSARFQSIGSASDRGAGYYASRAIEKINKNPNLSDREKKQMTTAIKKKTYPILFGIKNMKLEKVSELLDIVGMVPGVGDVVDLSNVIPKSILAYRYSFGPKKNEKFNFPFNLGSIDMSTFYYIDLMITLLSAFTIGEPLKVAKLAIQNGSATIKDIFVFSDLSLKFLQPFLVKGNPQTELYRLLRVLGAGNRAEVDEYLEKVAEVLIKMKEGAEKIQNARKFVNFKKAKELMSRTSQLGGYEAFEFLMGGGLLGKIISGTNKVKNIDEYVKAVDNLTNAILLKKADDISKTAIKITNPERFNEFLDAAEAGGLSKEALANLNNLGEGTKQSLGYIIEKLYKNYTPDTLGLDQIRDTIIAPLTAAAKEGVSEKEKIKGFIEALEKVSDNLPTDGQMIPILKKIDWSNGLQGARDYYKNLAQTRFKAGELSLAARKIVGDSDVVKSAMTKANEEIVESLKVMEEIRKNSRFLETASTSQRVAFERFDGPDWMSKVYENNMASVRGQLLQSGSKLVSDLSTNMAKKADELSVSFVGPFRRGPEKVSSFIAKNVVRNPILVQKFISFFVAFLNRNFFGKTYISNTFIVNGKIMNGAAFVLNKIKLTTPAGWFKALAPTPDGLAARISSAFMASAMFYWLRVLENEELAGGGGNTNLKKEQRGTGQDAKTATTAAATIAAIGVQIAAKEPAGLSEAATQTAASLRKQAEKTTNPALKKYIDSVQKELDKLAKELQAAKDKKTKETAMEKAAAALAAQANAAINTAQEQLQETQQESLSANKVPEKARQGAQGDTDTANGAETNATQQAAKKAGLGGTGTGGGKGTGTGKGFGSGIRDGSAVRDFLDAYLKQRRDESRHPTHGSVSSTLKQLDKDVGDKLYKIYKELIEFKEDKSYDELGRNLKQKPSLWLFGPALASKEDNVFFKTRYIKDLDKDKALEFLNNVNVEELKNHVIKESIEQYRNKVLNERYEKLLKGFTKEGK